MKTNSNSINPLESILIGNGNEFARAMLLALILMNLPINQIKERYFNSCGVKLLTAAILHILYIKKNKNLAAVTAFLSGIDPDTGEAYQGIKDWLGEMCGISASAIPHVDGYAIQKGISKEQAKAELGDLIDDEGYNKCIKQISSPIFYNPAEKEVLGITLSAKECHYLKNFVIAKPIMGFINNHY